MFREEWGRLLAALVRTLGDLDLAEEVAADAVSHGAAALADVDGVPDRPAAWLLTVARRRAVDMLRRDQALAARLALLQVEADRAEPPPPDRAGATDDVPDERLRLFFTCCHPALALEAQTALTLRCLAGLTTPEVARAFLRADRDDGPAARAGQAQDPRGPHPVPGAGARRAARRGCPACCGSST